MRCISVQQPHASLIAISAKSIETRSWSTSFRGPLAIHASKKFWRFNGKDETDRLMGLTLWESGLFHSSDDLPYGKVIATCNLVDCLYVKGNGLFHVIDKGPGYFTTAFRPERLVPEPDEPEFIFGDYTPGRFAWILEDVRQIEPVPAKGQLRLWNLPKGVLIP